MRLINFSAIDIHGFLRFNIWFRPNLTFLTGINGGGKTSAINAMVALIAPDLSLLAELEHKNIELELENNGQIFKIASQSDTSTVSLSVSGVENPFVFVRYVNDSDPSFARQFEAEAEYYRELMSRNSSHPVLQAIASLPTPMFLGIDRRAGFDEETMRRPRYPGSRSARSGRNIFSRSLSSSLSSAAYLAQDKYRSALIQSGRIAERLQKQMLLGLLASNPGEHETGSLTLPTPNDIKEIQRVRTDLATISQIMRLPLEQVQSRVSPLLDLLQSAADRIPEGVDLRKILGSEDGDSPVIDAIFKWSTNQIHLKRIKVISETVANYNQYRSKTLEPATRYQDLVNGFLIDSGKSISFSEDGGLSVKIDGVKGERGIHSLSSGEAQIFVILTQLAFNPLAAKNNVFIIDEPELSLHLYWQEIFVDSVLSANSNIQYILATHSPSIILDRIGDCIDISRKTRQGSRGA